MTDVVNGHIISTVGEYRPLGKLTMIGWNRYYETYVFPDSGRRCEIPECPCGGVPEPSSWSEVDSDGYSTEAEAIRGHAAMVAKYAAMKEDA